MNCPELASWKTLTKPQREQERESLKRNRLLPLALKAAEAEIIEALRLAEFPEEREMRHAEWRALDRVAEILEVHMRGND